MSKPGIDGSVMMDQIVDAHSDPIPGLKQAHSMANNTQGGIKTKRLTFVACSHEHNKDPFHLTFHVLCLSLSLYFATNTNTVTLHVHGMQLGQM